MNFFKLGFVRPQTKEVPPLIHVIAPPPSATTVRPIPSTTSLSPPPPKSDTALQATTTECPPNATTAFNVKSNNNLFRKLASSHYQSYTTALSVTIGVGCCLLLLNIIIFVGIYHQRDRGKKKKKEEEIGSCSSSSGENYEKAFESRMYEFEVARTANYKPNYECCTDVQMTELALQQFKSSPPPAKRHDVNPPDVTTINEKKVVKNK